MIIISVGIFFRTYHFHDWLLFKGDAFRDATMVSNAYRVGVESLPLLGPRAGGTMLHLGPIFYYFQYAAVSLFRSMSAPVLAYPDLFFSILTIPVFYCFSKRYFSSLWSLAMAAMLAVSFLAIEYGRFAWNPNSTLFFTLVFSYALLRLYDTESVAKNPLRWSFVAGTALAIASQLHFSAFLGLPIALILFLLLRLKDTKKVLSYKVVLVFLLSLLIVYAPVFISELFKQGENTRLFFSAISSKADSHGMLQNIFLVAVMFAKYFLRIGLGIVASGKTLLVLAGLFGGAGFLANVLLLRDEKNETKRNFLQWTLILISVYFLLYIPLAFKIDRPRFFLPFMMLPYLYLGYILVFLRKHTAYPRLIAACGLLGLGVVVYGNVSATVRWFSDLSDAQQTLTSTVEKNSKGKNFWLTWGHFDRAATAIDASCGKYSTIYFSMAKNIMEYSHSLEYALLQKGPEREIVIERKYASSKRAGCYYFIALPHASLPELIVQERRTAPLDVGNLHIIRFYPAGAEETPGENVVPTGKQKKETFFVPEKITRNSRVFWGDVWYKLRYW
ncbi:MAG: glycosyltransferase family 39 protein [Candidatus Moraniibacteriota bacterium]